MIVSALFFYLFAGVCVASAVMVIVSRNPVHSVLYLILAFVNASGLFVLMGAEFLGMMLIVVYVGAVAVLFLFVIMMLDVDFVELREGFLRFGTICAQEPLERIKRELLDRHDGERARPFPGAVPAHAVGHETEMCTLLANLQLRFRQTRLPDAHRFGEFGA